MEKSDIKNGLLSDDELNNVQGGSYHQIVDENGFDDVVNPATQKLCPECGEIMHMVEKGWNGESDIWRCPNGHGRFKENSYGKMIKKH